MSRGGCGCESRESRGGWREKRGEEKECGCEDGENETRSDQTTPDQGGVVWELEGRRVKVGNGLSKEIRRDSAREKTQRGR